MTLLSETWLAPSANHPPPTPLPARWSRYAPRVKALFLATDAALQNINAPRERIACVVAGADGCHDENRAYFADYLAGGRKLGRAALFIHTLPTAPVAECALHFRLRGPLLYALPEDGNLDDALALAEACLAQNDVDIILLLAQTTDRTGCLALTGPGLSSPASTFPKAGLESPGPVGKLLHAP